MKKFYYLIFCTFVGVTANAGQITEQQALQIAAKYADIDTKTYPQRMKAAGKQEKAAAYYAFNIGDNDGFVIVSGDDSLTELVGYSDSGSFDSDNIPDNLHSWLQTYSDYVASVQNGESKAKRQQLGKVTTVVVRPFVTTEWNQGEPYNRLTPILQGNTHCATGCVATAMAQVMKYYEWPERGTGSNKYQHSVFGTLSMDSAGNITVDEALGELGLFIDKCVLNNIEEIRIIHGKGTGALRKAVTDYLRSHPNISEYRLGKYGEGENGVTIAKVK